MEGLVGKVSNYWTPSIRLEVPLPGNKADKILVPIELTVRGQIITLNRGGMAYLYRGPTVCREKSRLILTTTHHEVGYSFY